MARSVDVADVPALLEAMVGWLDPANDVGESAILRRWQAEGGVRRDHWPKTLARRPILPHQRRQALPVLSWSWVPSL
jgi:hypothetical protein